MVPKRIHNGKVTFMLTDVALPHIPWVGQIDTYYAIKCNPISYPGTLMWKNWFLINTLIISCCITCNHPRLKSIFQKLFSNIWSECKFPITDMISLIYRQQYNRSTLVLRRSKFIRKKPSDVLRVIYSIKFSRPGLKSTIYQRTYKKGN